jgi:hypothetical protein
MIKRIFFRFINAYANAERGKMEGTACRRGNRGLEGKNIAGA